jgi:RHS repeat-associated protein
VEDLNPAGYAQALDEIQNGSVVRTYTCGLELIAQTRAAAFAESAARQLLRFRWPRKGTRVYLFAGEQFDPDLNLYYNRARYLNTTTGRFWSMDLVNGDPSAPLSLHKYSYAALDPANEIDPTGLTPLTDFLAKLAARTWRETAR